MTADEATQSARLISTVEFGETWRRSVSTVRHDVLPARFRAAGIKLLTSAVVLMFAVVLALAAWLVWLHRPSALRATPDEHPLSVAPKKNLLVPVPVGALPTGTVDTCMLYTSENGWGAHRDLTPQSVGDSGIRFTQNRGKNSCEFVYAVALKVRILGSQGRANKAFPLSVQSAFRVNKPELHRKPDVPLTCTPGGAWVHCVSTDDLAAVDMYVK